MLPHVMHAAALLDEMFDAAVWTSTVLALCIVVCLRLLPALPATFRSAVWMLAFATAIVLPLLMFLHQPAGYATQAPPVRLNVLWAVPVAALWLLLSLLRTFGLLRGTVYLRAVTRSATQTGQCQTLAEWLNGRAGAKFRRHVQVCVAEGVDRPSVVGYLHPRILLPLAVMDGTSETDLQRILLHEWEHVRRFDDCTNLLQKVGLTLFPFSPGLLWMERRLCLERELACDDAVLRETGAPKAYAACLIQLAERSLGRRASALTVSALGRQSDVSRRVGRVLQWPPREASRVSRGLACAVLLCAVSTATVALGHGRLLIDFHHAVTAPMLATESHTLVVTPEKMAGRPARNSVPHLITASFTFSKRSSSAHTRAHHRRPAEKALVPSVLPSAVVTDSAQERATTMQANRLVEYTPAERDEAPVLQQISLPYAVIPTGDGWLIVQL